MEKCSPLSPIHACLQEIHERHAGNRDGKVADYIPELAKVDPDLFGICLATADGAIYEVGHSRHDFTIQSISKAFVYGLAIEDRGVEEVTRKVGVEPTGEAFNSIIFDEVNNRPYNPMVNAGAIATTALIAGEGTDRRFGRILELFERFAGRSLSIDEAVYRSEKETGHRNRAIAYLELNAGMIDEPVNEHLDLYFRQCSILVTARDLAIMAATLANNGINPITGDRAIAPARVRSILSVMTSCGMYDFSGEWLYRVGLPAKSGVGGGIIAVLPGQFGIGIFSPRLDDRGNSVRGIRVCEELSERYRFHLFDIHSSVATFVCRSYTGASVSSKRQRRQWERALLNRLGSGIVVLELQGDLYFATIEKLNRYLQEYGEEITFLVLDGRRIGFADRGALTLLEQIREGFADRGTRILLSGFPSSLPPKLQERGWSPEDIFVNLDAALEWSENRLLATVGPLEEPSEILPLARVDIFQGFNEEEIAAIAAIAREEHYPRDRFILREGETADRLFLLASGTVTVSLQLPGDGGRKRLITYMPGVAFGESVLFEAGKRTADAIADTDVTCYTLPLDRLQELAETNPGVYIKLLRAFGKNLMDTLRRATTEIRVLAGN
jgi:glutaminase